MFAFSSFAVWPLANTLVFCKRFMHSEPTYKHGHCDALNRKRFTVMKTTTEKNHYFLLFSYNFYDVRITTMSVSEATRTNEKKSRWTLLSGEWVQYGDTYWKQKSINFSADYEHKWAMENTTGFAKHKKNINQTNKQKNIDRWMGAWIITKSSCCFFISLSHSFEIAF